MVQTQTQFAKEWLVNDQILCYRIYDLHPTTVNLWAADLSSTLNDWPADQPWRLMLDVRLRGSIVSAYALRRAREIASLRPELPGRLAVLVASKLAHDIIAMALRNTNNQFRQRSVFVNEFMAIQWLLDGKKPAVVSR